MNKRFSRILTASVVALASVPVLAQRAYADSFGMSHYGWGWGHMMFGSLMMVVFWGLVILLVVLVVRRIGGDSSEGTPAASKNPALEILQERFARGDIEKDEFENRKRLLAN
ncbi:MAG: SHOCT domain-containing protein [Proteobacteria bacterium]|nr:SHOCT domain-containing protein [Pseudomonadota bacterium]